MLFHDHGVVILRLPCGRHESSIADSSSGFMVERKEWFTGHGGNLRAFFERVYWLFYDGASCNEFRKISWCILSILSSNVADQTQTANITCNVIPCTNGLSDDFCERLDNFICSDFGNFLSDCISFVLVLQLQTVHDFEKSASRDRKTSQQHIFTRIVEVAR